MPSGGVARFDLAERTGDFAARVAGPWPSCLLDRVADCPTSALASSFRRPPAEIAPRRPIAARLLTSSERASVSFDRRILR